MRCSKCGREVNNEHVFCPYCENPLKVTADIDYIQQQIGSKVGELMDGKDSSAEDTVGNTITGDTVVPSAASGQADENDSVFSQSRKSSVPGPKKQMIRLPAKKENEEARAERLRKRAEQELQLDKEKNKKKRLIILIICLAVVVVAAVFGIVLFTGGSKNQPEETTPTSEAPKDVVTCNVEAGETYTVPLKIILKSANGNRIYYTLDGTLPTLSSEMFTGAFTITESMIEEKSKEITLNVTTFSATSLEDGKLSVTFTIQKPELDTPVITPSSGNYQTSREITITAAEGAEIFYTYDGTTPTRNSAKYTGPIKMKRGNHILSAVACKDDMSSEVSTAVFNLEEGSVIGSDQARSLIIVMLTNQGMITDTSLKTADGGSMNLTSITTAEYDGSFYMVFQADKLDADGNITETGYFGVDDVDGGIFKMMYDNGSYIPTAKLQ
ncbi:MAG: chitobiase/beta-hexosaminidase C-terminal domain-containing protein [Parasporobacterium sp.]|nr:chitobiase/beta-hexosaminidase C-terminal domain-containing protein [Parasporobacterium sp.]